MIITADDFGKIPHATDSILKCFFKNRITSSSAMVFMEDSERASSLALQNSLEVGLHLNFTETFTADKTSSEIRYHQNKVISFLKLNRFAQIIYNPLLKESFRLLFRSQYEEFVKLYKKTPDFINGHHHMHLCTNVLAGSLIQRGTRIRGTFTFGPGEKDPFNRLYRRILKMWITKRFITTDSFYSIEPVTDIERLHNIFKKAERENIEIEVHPENAEEMEFLLSDKYKNLLDSVQVGSFKNIK